MRKIKFQTEHGVPYADAGLTTSISRRVLEAMLPHYEENFGDPDGIHEIGRKAGESFDEYRYTVAECFEAKPENVWFTSGGTESNNWVIRNFATGGKVACCSTVEHLSVAKPVEFSGGTFIPVDGNGNIDLVKLEALSSEYVSLVSVQHTNQDTGVIQDIRAIADICKGKGLPLHVDASMAVGMVFSTLLDDGADFITISGHKVWGPNGIGALISSGSFPIYPFLHGGGQQGGMRAGAINMAGVAGLAAALEQLVENNQKWKKVEEIRNGMESELKGLFGITVYGEQSKRAPNMSCIGFPGKESAMLVSLAEKSCGVCLGVGSADDNEVVSRTLLAMGVKRGEAESAVRVRFGADTRKVDADSVVVALSYATARATIKGLF